MTPIQAAYGVARQGLRPAIPSRTPPKLAQLIQVGALEGWMDWFEQQHPALAKVSNTVCSRPRSLFITTKRLAPPYDGPKAARPLYLVP